MLIFLVLWSDLVGESFFDISITTSEELFSDACSSISFIEIKFSNDVFSGIYRLLISERSEILLANLDYRLLNETTISFSVYYLYDIQLFPIIIYDFSKLKSSFLIEEKCVIISEKRNKIMKYNIFWYLFI